MAKSGKRSFFNWCKSWTPEQIMTLFTAVLTVCAIGSWVVSYMQWDAARKQLKFAIESASDSASGTQKALANSDRVARAAEGQAAALNAQAGSLNNELTVLADQAEALKQSVAVSRSQLATSMEVLRLDRAGYVVVTASPINLGDELVPPSAVFRIRNVSKVGIRNLKIYANMKLTNPAHTEEVWDEMKIPIILSMLPPDGVEEEPVNLLRPLDEDLRLAIGAGRFDIVYATRVEFINRGESEVQTTYSCYRYFMNDEKREKTVKCPPPVAALN